jgi:DNA topoisomerase VI subunit B
VELTENGRDNASDVTLVIDVESSREERGTNLITPRKITCVDNGTGLSHEEFLSRFCGAFSDSEIHHEVDRAGRNGVGTKTYGSIADRVIVTTTTAGLPRVWINTANLCCRV